MEKKGNGGIEAQNRKKIDRSQGGEKRGGGEGTRRGKRGQAPEGSNLIGKNKDNKRGV